MRLFPRAKLLGRKARSEPDISIMLRTAMTESMRPSWKRSTMSAAVLGFSTEWGLPTCTHDLEQILLFKLLEYGWWGQLRHCCQLRSSQPLISTNWLLMRREMRV